MDDASEGLHFAEAVGEYFDGSDVPSRPIFSILGFDKSRAHPEVIELIDYLREHDTIIEEIERGVHSYLQFQDLLSLELDAGYPMYNRHYCYYESVVYMREGLKCWLSGLTLAAIVLIRPFIELSVMHLYWFMRSSGEGYTRFYKWLEQEATKSKPQFKQQVDFVFDRLREDNSRLGTRLDITKDVILGLYSWGSAYNHTPKIEESTIAISKGMLDCHPNSLLQYIYTLSITLSALCCKYSDV